MRRALLLSAVLVTTITTTRAALRRALASTPAEGSPSGDDKSLLEKGKGPFGATLVFKDGGDIARRFGEAAASVGAIVDTVVLADAAYYVGYAGLSTFDRTLVDIRATRDQWDARLARPDNCTFTVGKNTQRGVADHDPNEPAGVYMRHFRSLP